MPRKIRELIADLMRAGFSHRGGKGSHRKFTHPRLRYQVILSGQSGDDAQSYREREVREALEELET